MKQETVSCDDEEKGKLPCLWADAGCLCQLVGGGPTCLWLSPSPCSLLWRKRQMESEGSAPVSAQFLQSSSFLA